MKKSKKLAGILVATAGLAGHMWLPYQIAWIKDDSPSAIWEKSRRIGADYCESYRCVAERMSGDRTMDYWYSSADESAALEFAEYVRGWLELWEIVAIELVDKGIDNGNDWLKMSFELPEINGKRPRITVMTSSPKRFRSKGGDVTISELAFHEQADEMWKAAAPAATWGGRIRVLSSHNGFDSKFNSLLMQALRHEDPEIHGQPKAMDFKASVHRTDIYDAVEDGLCERINEKSNQSMTRDEFIASLKAKCSTTEVWEEEYECKPSRQGGSYFPHALISPCVSGRAAVPTDDLDVFISDIALRSNDYSRFNAGADIGRTSDRFVIWVWGRSGTSRVCVGMLVYKNQPFDVMEVAINSLMNRTFGKNRVTRICIDKTGLGMQLAERMEKKHRARAEGLTMTTATKEDMFTRLRAGFEERTVEIPDDVTTQSDISSIRKEVTVAGHVRYSAKNNRDGHSDRCTAGALGLVADESSRTPMRVVSMPEGVL